jgi:hypothetical protein
MNFVNSFFSLTPKALRVEELRAQGMNFNDALNVADREYTSDGMTSTEQPGETDGPVYDAGYGPNSTRRAS